MHDGPFGQVPGVRVGHTPDQRAGWDCERLPFPPLSPSTKGLGKTLFLDEDAEKYFYVPHKVAPRKNEKSPPYG